MIRCARCHRPVLHPVHIAGMSLGSHCASLVSGAKPRRARLFTARMPAADPRQTDLFKGAVA